MSTWWDRPYDKGAPVGPDRLPRALSPPSAGKGTFTGDDVTAVKRGISRAGRFEPWNPDGWDRTYGEVIALGRGTGKVGDTGVRGFQRQEFPTASQKQTGIVNEETYQHMRRALVPEGREHAGKHIFDDEALRLLRAAEQRYSPAEVAWTKLYAAMKLMSAVTPGYQLGGGHGLPLYDVSAYQKLDCSSSCSKALYEANLFEGRSYAIVSGDFREWGEPGTGKIFTCYYNSTHVFLRLHRSIYWRFDTSPHGDGGRGPKLRILPRFTSGFGARHYPGM